MRLGSCFVTSLRMCFSTEDYNEWVNEHYENNNDNDEKIILKWFFYLIVKIVRNIESLQIIIFIFIYIPLYEYLY